ncbi:MFS general substrate transporter, partial [Melanogaster broomeanus]
GRRLIYLCGAPFLCIGSLGVAASSSLLPLLLWRFIQAFGCAGAYSLGAGVIGDIFELEERGTAIGAVLLGPALAPLAGGTTSQYFSWRHIHLAFAVWGFLQFLLIYFSFPETSHLHHEDVTESTAHKGARLVWINPFKCLGLLRSPNIFAITLHSAFALLTDFVLLIPLAHTIGARYHITNEALIGACFLPNGIGNFLGAPMAGRLSDITVKEWRKKRHGVWVPEDRLRKTWIGALVLCPLSIAVSGLLTTFVDGPLGLGLNLFCLFCNGAGVDFVMNPIVSYTVDLTQSQGAELLAAENAVRSLVVALGSAIVLPSIEHIGVAWTNGIAALLVWFKLVALTIRYGDRMRAAYDIGYTTTPDARS